MMTIYSECSKALTAENLCQELAVLRLSHYLLTLNPKPKP